MTAEERAKLDKIIQIMQQKTAEIEQAKPGPSAYQIGYHTAMKDLLAMLKLAGMA